MSRIILPLDGLDMEKYESIIKTLQKASKKDPNLIWGVKVNDLLVDNGVEIIKELKYAGYKVFADPKLYDIPNTMRNSIKHLVNVEADIITVHCSARYIPTNQKEANRIAGVTVLTSMDEARCQSVYGKNVGESVCRFAHFAAEYKYGYLVCAARDLNFLPNMFNTKLICPGIRPDWYQISDDQKRVMTPAEAIKAGADLLVIGRPILQANDMVDALVKTNEEIEGLCEHKINDSVE